MELREKIYFTPFLKLLIAVIAGVLCSEFFPASNNQLVYLLALLSGICALIFKPYGSLYLYLCTFIFAYASNHSNITDNTPTGQGIWSVIIEKPLSKSENWTRYSALVSAHKPKEEKDWQSENFRIILVAENQLELHSTELISIDSPIKTDIYPYYKTQGYKGLIFARENQIIARSKASNPPLRVRIAALQEKALEKLARLKLSDVNQQIASAMILGYKSELNRQTRKEYSLSGSAHLLAVSGLHIGIIFALINLLLSPLKILRRGHLIVNLLCIVLIWCYALLTGLSPSALRGAFMFSMLQLALFNSLNNNSLNSLSATACIMILFDTNALFDLSFQLSFTAVFFILTCFNPLYRKLRSTNRWVNLLIEALLISFIASVAVMPLSSYYFGAVTTLGFVFAPILILLSSVVLWLGMSWIILPLEFMRSEISWLIDHVLELQNLIINWIYNLSFSHFDFKFSMPMCVLIYFLLVILAFRLWASKPNIKPLLDEF